MNIFMGVIDMEVSEHRRLTFCRRHRLVTYLDQHLGP